MLLQVLVCDDMANVDEFAVVASGSFVHVYSTIC